MSVGELLKKRRLEKRHSLEEVALKLKISSRKIWAIENNKWFSLPAPVYVRSYLKKYAAFLGLNEETILKTYEEESQAQSELLRLPSVENLKFVLTPKTIVFILAVIFLGLVGVNIVVSWVALASPPTIVLEQPSDNLITDQSELAIVGRVDSVMKLTINGATVYPDSDGHFKTLRFLQAGLNTIEIRAVNNLGKETVLYRQVLLQQKF